MTIKRVDLENETCLNIICECGSTNVDHINTEDIQIVDGILSQEESYICLDCEAIISEFVPIRCGVNEKIVGEECFNDAYKFITIGNYKCPCCEEHYTLILNSVMKEDEYSE